MITEEMNMKLIMDISLEEVHRILFSLNPEKASGPDGLTELFYQKLWDIVGMDLHQLVKDFFDSGAFDGRIKETNIYLILKTRRPK